MKPLPRLTIVAFPKALAMRTRIESAPWRVRATSHKLPPSSNRGGAATTMRSTITRPARIGGFARM